MHYIFPTKFVYWEKIPDHEHQKIKEKYLEYINNDIAENGDVYRKTIKEKWDCRCLSTFFEENGFFPEVKKEDFYNLIVWNPMDNMLKEMEKSFNLPIPKHSRMTQMWFNQYESGEWQEIHEHSSVNFSKSSTYSGIYLLDLNEKNPTFFVDENLIKCWKGGRMTALNVFSTDFLEEGMVILFPSELLHYVNPCINQRTTISFNIDSIFD